MRCHHGGRCCCCSWLFVIDGWDGSGSDENDDSTEGEVDRNRLTDCLYSFRLWRHGNEDDEEEFLALTVGVGAVLWVQGQEEKCLGLVLRLLCTGWWTAFFIVVNANAAGFPLVAVAVAVIAVIVIVRRIKENNLQFYHTSLPISNFQPTNQHVECLITSARARLYYEKTWRRGIRKRAEWGRAVMVITECPTKPRLLMECVEVLDCCLNSMSPCCLNWKKKKTENETLCRRTNKIEWTKQMKKANKRQRECVPWYWSCSASYFCSLLFLRLDCVDRWRGVVNSQHYYFFAIAVL